ncbi:hypothetical protein MIND_00516600 [Mycena indigotica]|uniref:Uncharacterized protein n=1 Tax=Mycena indigotica TaxID=2126181 RepID=A0A8H6W646_9AGAR|nr:uncharacterized protein MIND_00516600 [Mycena indigotica]KAF7307229.1 hypothetical protein MIND_00516600 [Mycena indigotica]
MYLRRDQATLLDALPSPASVEFVSSDGIPSSPYTSTIVSPATTSVLNASPTHTTQIKPLTIIAVLTLLILALWAIAFGIFAPSMLKSLRVYLAKKRQQKQAKRRARHQPEGLGFGYDGLSQGEIDELRRMEEEEGERYFVRLSPSPPSLQVIEPLPPISLPTSKESEVDNLLDKKKELEVDSESYIEPAPAYEA